MKQVIQTLFFGTFTLILCGCVNPYAAYYRDNHKSGTFADPRSRVDVTEVTDDQWNDTISKMKIAGWICVGSSDFQYRGGLPPYGYLLSQARHVHSDKVVIVSKVVGIQTVAPVITYQPGQTSTTTTSGQITSGYNYGYYSENSTTTTPGQYGIDYVPTDIPIYEVGASFWRRESTSP